MDSEGQLEAGLMSAEARRRATSRTNSALSRTSIDDQIKVTVETRDLNYFVGGRKNEKQILHNVSVRFEPGELTCLMGPSGAGKTTLLSCLLGNAGGRIKGSIRVNGMEGPPKDFKSISKLIPQEDVLLASFSVRETFYYQAELVMPSSMSREEKDKRIKQVVDALNLESCLDVKVGTVEDRGISGGQRKRVSIGMDLLSNPACLFVDEPTSGLDSKTAEDVVIMLRDLAHGNNESGYQRTIISTIHQPSYRIFSLFDKVVLLTKGHVAFQGSLENLETFFDRLALSTPPKENPADHYMRMLQDETEAERIWCDFSAQEKARRSQLAGNASDSENTEEDDGSASTFENIDDSSEISGSRPWCSSGWWRCWPSKTNDSVGEQGEFGYHDMMSVLEQQQRMKEMPKYPTSITWQLWTLFKRSTYDSIKDPNKAIRILALKLAVGVLIGIVWWHAANPPRFQKLFPIEGAMFCILMNSCIDTLAMTIIVFPTQRSLLIREYKNGSYSLIAFYPALMLSMGLMSLVYALFMTVPIYLMVELQMTPMKFIYFILIVVFMTCIGNALGVIVGATSKDLVTAQNKLMPALAPQVLFSGYVIPYSQMNSVWRIFYHISFFQYALSAMQLNQLTDLTFDLSLWGVELPVPGEYVLKNFFSLDPETHKVSTYVLIMFAYAVGITFFGYWIIKADLSRKTG